MKIILTEAYERAIEQIEDFIFAGSHDVEFGCSFGRFLTVVQMSFICCTLSTTELRTSLSIREIQSQLTQLMNSLFCLSTTSLKRQEDKRGSVPNFV